MPYITFELGTWDLKVATRAVADNLVAEIMLCEAHTICIDEDK